VDKLANQKLKVYDRLAYLLPKINISGSIK